jgi:cytochrome c
MRKLAFSICSSALIIGSTTLPAQDKKGDAAKGKEVFEQCSVCHNTDSDEKKMGPGLKGLFKKAKLANGKAPTDANVAAKINEGGNGMPAYADMLTDTEKADLLAYLKTL